MNDFLKDVIKETGNEYAGIVSEGVEAGDVDSFIDTGSYIFNALVSGSLYGGLPQNKITALAGESATGKTFFLMGMVKNFLDQHENGGVVYFAKKVEKNNNEVDELVSDLKIKKTYTEEELKTELKMKGKSNPWMNRIIDYLFEW